MAFATVFFIVADLFSSFSSSNYKVLVSKTSKMATTFSAEEVAKHNNRKDCWVIYRGKVYDVTNFLDQHPGGEEVLLDLAGIFFAFKY